MGEDSGFSRDDLAAFQRDGFLIARALGRAELVAELREVVREQLAERLEPLELEADLNYPGAPASAAAPGGDAIRRLRQAYGRHPVFAQWLDEPGLRRRLQQLLGPTVLMPLAHHNCVMTKHPRFSSDSLWHQDIRYWRYRQGDLVTAWLALGREYERNGGLQVIPGTHRMTLERERFDEALFFRHDLPENQPLLARRRPVELEAGDVLFFHSKLLHAATRNHEQSAKYSVVFTFRAPADAPLPGTRSAAQPDIEIARAGAGQ